MSPEKYVIVNDGTGERTFMWEPLLGKYVPAPDLKLFVAGERLAAGASVKMGVDGKVYNAISDPSGHRGEQ